MLRWLALPSCWRFCLRCCKGWSCPWRRSTSRWSRGSLSHFIGVSLNIITFTPLAPISYHFDHACLTQCPCPLTMFASNRVANLWPTIIFDLNQGDFLPHLLCPTFPLLQPTREKATLPGWPHLPGTIFYHIYQVPSILIITRFAPTLYIKDYSIYPIDQVPSILIITRCIQLISILSLFFPLNSLFRASWGTGRAGTRPSSCSSSTRWTTCSPAASLPPIFSRPSGGRLVQIVITAPIASIFIYFGQKQSTNIFYLTLPDASLAASKILNIKHLLKVSDVFRYSSTPVISQISVWSKISSNISNIK